MRHRLAFVLALLVPMLGAGHDAAELATCKGSPNCKACHDCSKCKYCNAGKGTCGVCYKYPE